MTGTWSPDRVRTALADEAGVMVFRGEDVRGFRVQDLANERVGVVDDLVIDTAAGKVRFLKVGVGGILGFGRTPRLVPVGVVENVVDESVFLTVSRAQVDTAPAWSDIMDGSYLAEVCAHFGCQPYWSAGYRDPTWAAAEPDDG